MGIEIERKFLVDFVSIPKMLNVSEVIKIRQGYILNSPKKVVRIRTSNEVAYITIKGENVGVTRPEYEYEIPIEDANVMLDTMCGDIIEKTRHIVKISNDVWEIDQFHGNNEGLTIAELEVPSEDYVIVKPFWVGDEIVDDPRYFNNNLAKVGYLQW
jgi:adenylate cyclase